MTTQAKLDTKVKSATATPAQGRKKRSQRSPAEIAAERKLIREVQAGNTKAFETLVKSYEQKIFWVAFNHVNNAEDAKDVVQDAFLRVHRAIDRFDLRYNFYTWLYRIVVNLSIDKLRKRGKQNSVSIEEFPTDPAIDASPEQALRNTETGQKIQEVLDSLPEKYSTVIMLRDVHEMSCEEISQIIDCTNATTRWRLHRAREMFKARWEKVVV